MAADESFYAYGEQHPWRMRLVGVPSLSLLGLNAGYARSMWGLGAGVGVQRELGRRAVRLEGLARLGVGPYRDFDITDGSHPRLPNKAIYGAEVYSAYLIRPHPFYVGPAIALGLLFQEGGTFIGEGEDEEPEPFDVPSRAFWLAAGGTIGWEHDPQGKFDFGLRAMLGAWDTFRRVYIQLGLQIAVVIGD